MTSADMDFWMRYQKLPDPISLYIVLYFHYHALVHGTYASRHFSVDKKERIKLTAFFRWAVRNCKLLWIAAFCLCPGFVFAFSLQNSLQWKTKEKEKKHIHLDWIRRNEYHKNINTSEQRDKNLIFLFVNVCISRMFYSVSFSSFFGCVRVHNVNFGRCLCCVPFVLLLFLGLINIVIALIAIAYGQWTQQMEKEQKQKHRRS